MTPSPHVSNEMVERALTAAWGHTTKSDVPWQAGEIEQMRRALTAALSAMPGTQVQEGWKLVPIEPTPEMRRAFHEAHEEYENGGGVAPDLQWKAMLAALPTPPTAQEG